MKVVYLAAAAALPLTACSTTGYGYHDAIKLQTGGINMNGSTGVSAGYLGATIDRVANVDKNGAAITVKGPCPGGADIFDTYANLNSKASAQATSVVPAGTASTAAPAAGGVNNPQIAWASGDVTANGDAAFIASTVATGHPADTIAALCGNPSLPSAPAGTIVRDGVAPAPTAPAAKTSVTSAAAAG